ncbi:MULTISPECIES: hypothetical protein [Myxococcaceae]|uniref:hypothetical protein n=1 Tax=Myxococcaceae TaxID=31 RepID=UPI001E4C6F02|nr:MULTISPECIES: hypothetical protein [Myxococcaceae]
MIGAKVEYLYKTNHVEISLDYVDGFRLGAFTDYNDNGMVGGGCSPFRPSTATITYDPIVADWLMRKYKGLSMNFDQMLAHELGHLYYANITYWTGQTGTKDASDAMSLRWENTQRGAGPYRVAPHDP